MSFLSLLLLPKGIWEIRSLSAPVFLTPAASGRRGQNPSGTQSPSAQGPFPALGGKVISETKAGAWSENSSSGTQGQGQDLPREVLLPWGWEAQLSQAKVLEMEGCEQGPKSLMFSCPGAISTDDNED